jgi:hypothetical protein
MCEMLLVSCDNSLLRNVVSVIGKLVMTWLVVPGNMFCVEFVTFIVANLLLLSSPMCVVVAASFHTDAVSEANIDALSRCAGPNSKIYRLVPDDVLMAQR